MSTEDDGGHAFPKVTGFHRNDQSHTYLHSTITSTDGMSLRDYFAGQALIGTCLHSDAHHWSPEGIAERAHRIADAMLKAREARHGK